MPNLPYGFDVYKVKIKTTRQIGQIFVAFSEKLNFTGKTLFFKKTFSYRNLS